MDHTRTHEKVLALHQRFFVNPCNLVMIMWHCLPYAVRLGVARRGEGLNYTGGVEQTYDPVRTRLLPKREKQHEVI